MSAVIQNEYTGNNSTTTYSFTFPYLKTSDIKASLDGVATTAFTLPNATTLQFNTAPGSGVKIKIFRETSVDDLTATFYAGSAIKSEDLNDNFTQNLYKTQEVGARAISALGGTMTGNLTLDPQADLVFEGATADAHETTIKVVDPTADRTITFPNVTGTVVTTGDTGTVATGMIAADAINGTKIADDSINSEHYVDASIDTQHIADDQITTAKLASAAVTNAKLAGNAVTTAKILDDQVTTAKIADTSITTAKLAADAVTNAKIADNSIDSEHYVDGSIDNAHLADNSVTLAKMADDSVGTAELVDSSVVTAALADNSVTLAKMADNAVGTSELVDSAVTSAKLASNAVTTAKITDANVTTAKLAADAVTNDKLADNSVSTENIQDGDISTAKLADSGITTAKIANDAVTTVKIANDAITSGKIAAGAVDSSDIGNGAIDTVHIGSAQVTTAKIADSNVTTAKISDANVTTAKIADDAITIGKIGCEQTTISDSDSHIPTSGAVVDYVAAQIAPLGGLEVIATEVAFPNTQPSSGVVISISDAAGVVVNGSGTSTTGRTVGGSTVTINNFPSSLNNETLATGVGLMVSSTGSSQIYNYHKILAAETDVKQLSDDINDFNARYRVGSSNPTSALDNGDLFFNTGTGKMLVYNGTNTAWEEVQSIGNFFISTLSPAFDGSTQNFTLTNAPTNVQQVILSINGVIQKPNAGTSTPSEGFALDGSTIKLAGAPASGASYFAIVMGSTVNIGTPSNNTVSTAVLQDDSVTNAKIAAGAVGSTELAANAVITSKIADSAITAAKLASGAADLAADTSPQLGGNLDLNSNDISGTGNISVTGNISGNALTTTNGGLILNSSVPTISFVDSDGNPDYEIKVNGGEFDIRDSTNSASKFKINSSGEVVSQTKLNCQSGLDTDGDVVFNSDTTNVNVTFDASTQVMKFSDSMSAAFGDHSTTGDYSLSYVNGSDFTILGMGGGSGDLVLGTYASGTTTKTLVSKRSDNSLELYHNNVKTFQTTSSGVELPGSNSLFLGGKIDMPDNSSGSNGKILLGTGDDLELYHDGTNSTIRNTTGQLQLRSDIICLENNDGSNYASITGARFDDNAKARFGTGNDLQIYHSGTQTYIVNGTGALEIQNGSRSIDLKTDTITFKNGNDNETMSTFTADGSVDLYYDNSKKFETTSAGVSITGSLTASGNITAYSDERLKENVQTINDALSICGQLRGVRYTWKKEQYKDVGLIAQEVEKVLPEVVWPVDNGIKTIDYGRIVGVLVNAINELKMEVDKLKGGE